MRILRIFTMLVGLPYLSLQASNDVQEINMLDEDTTFSIIGSGLFHTIEVRIPETQLLNEEGKYIRICLNDENGQEIHSMQLGEGMWIGNKFSVVAYVWQTEHLYKMMQESVRIGKILASRPSEE